jgi:Flp pilus assembly protein TadG
MAALIVNALRRWRCDSGAEFVEAALAFPLLLLIVLGIMDFGLMFQQYEVITNAAREGARIAVLPNYNDADVTARVNQYIDASFLSTGGSVTVAPVARTNVVITAGKCMTAATVSLTYPHEFFFLGGIGNYFGATFGTKTLRASSTMRAEITAATCP